MKILFIIILIASAYYIGRYVGSAHEKQLNKTALYRVTDDGYIQRADAIYPNGDPVWVTLNPTRGGGSNPTKQ